MFGTDEVARIAMRELKTIPDVVSTAGGRMFYLPLYPEDQKFPGILVYPLFTDYGDAPIDEVGDPVFERVDVEIRLIAEGSSSTPIRAAATAQFRHFAHARFDEEINGANWVVQFTPKSEISLPALVEGTSTYRQLGTVYTVELTKGA